MKLCPKCNSLKSLDDFFKNKNKSSGYTSHCKECCKLRDRSGCKKYQKNDRKILTDGYIVVQLRCKGFERKNINTELIQIQRLLITLKRTINELQRNNRSVSGCQ